MLSRSAVREPRRGRSMQVGESATDSSASLINRPAGRELALQQVFEVELSRFKRADGG